MTQKYYQIFKKEQGFTLTLTSFNKTLLLRNERRIKDRIIQSLLETQNVATHSFSNLKAKQLEQIVNLFWASEISLSSTATNSKTSTTTKPTKHDNLRGNLKKSELQPTKTTKFREPEKFFLVQDELKTLYGSHLPEDINERALFELFGLRTTNHLRDNFDIQRPLSGNTGKKESLLM